MPSYTTFPPSGFDRATGLAPFPGTPDPPKSIIQGIATQSPAGGYFEEMPDSPEIEFGEQATVVHTYEMDESVFYFLVPGLQRGQVWQDSGANTYAPNLTKILSTQAQWQKPGRVRVRIVTEGLSFGIPPDEFTIESFDNNPDILKHPRYNQANGLTDQQKGVIRYYVQSTGMAPSRQSLDLIFASGYGPVGGSLMWTDQQKQMAWEIITKYWRGEETFYLPCIRVTYSYYNFSPIPMDMGGYIEDPVASGNLPYSFWSIDGTPRNTLNNNILQYFPKTLGYNLYSNGVSYLRQADQEPYQRTWFKLTRSWVGAPTGKGNSSSAPGQPNDYIHWDSDFYQVPPTPLNPLPST